MREMTPTSFACPACRSPLRLRERRFVGASFPCPACQTRLTLLEVQDADVVVRLAEELATPEQPQVTVAAQSRLRLPSWTIPEWLTSPVTISWIVAISVAAVLVSLALRTEQSRLVPQPAPVPRDEQATADQPETLDASGVPWRAMPEDTSETRLQKLGQRLAAYRAQSARFPTGTVNEQWSWLADLERQFPATQLSGIASDPQKSWRDPANERFVRRQLPEFQFSGHAQTVGEQGYPTTHFVGSGGVGRDGVTLPVNHPRAGLFGAGRTTRDADVIDGLANTVAVLGIETSYGSWAEGGPATIRPLTAEPYVHGPDGFGTGPGGEMLVLMADGSVRTISAATDPRLVRRMVAIADRLPLDPLVPGEPGDVPTTIPRELPPAVAVNPPDEPAASALEVQNPPVAVPIRNLPDWDTVLQQRLLRFELIRPVPRKALLIDLEDLLGRRIVWQAEELGPSLPFLDQSIQLQLTNVTVADVLDRILADTGLSFHHVGDEVRLQRTAKVNTAQ